jgi:type IV pilus assembly protein PilC
VERVKENIAIIDFLKFKIPFIGSIIVENAMAIFSRTLSILISGGIPVPESTAIAVETFSNRYFYINVRDVPSKIKEGNLLSDVLGEVDFIPGMMVEVIRVGESSGNLPEVLNKNGDYYENAINLKVNTIISLIEPVLIIFLGMVIAFMLISVYLPIFQTVQVVR